MGTLRCSLCLLGFTGFNLFTERKASSAELPLCICLIYLIVLRGRKCNHYKRIAGYGSQYFEILSSIFVNKIAKLVGNN